VFSAEMEYFFSNQAALADSEEFDLSSDFSADESEELMTDDLTDDNQEEEVYFDDENFYDELSKDPDVDDDAMMQFTLSTLKNDFDSVDDIERDDDSTKDSSEEPFLAHSFEPDLPQLDTPFTVLSSSSATNGSNKIVTGDNSDSSTWPVFIVGAAFALTALVVVMRRRSNLFGKKGNKESYSIASSPTIKRDLGV
jgi:hypothetical protein